LRTGRPHRGTRTAATRLDPPPAATLTSPRLGPVPPRTGATRPPRTAAAAGIPEFRKPCALNGKRAPAGRDASRSPAAATNGTHDPAHGTLNADPAASSTRFRRACPHRDQRQAASRGQRVTAPAARAAGRVGHATTPPAEARRLKNGHVARRWAGSGQPGRRLARYTRTLQDQRTFRTASYSVLLYVYLPTAEPPDPANAQAVPGINLRVNSQTIIRAQLVKQS